LIRVISLVLSTARLEEKKKESAEGKNRLYQEEEG
jgi:hypothetical protein